MSLTHSGELAALLTAIFWTVTALAFESASKKIGSLAVNFLRLFAAFFLLGIYTWITRGYFFPVDATAHNWYWLMLSGIIGFTIGDMALFQSFVLIGARVAMLLMSLVPPFAALAGWLIMGEKLSIFNLAGMGLTLSGIALVVLGRNGTDHQGNSVRIRYSTAGILLAILAAAGQAVGLVISKYGMGDYNPFAASQIRVLTGTVGFMLVFTFFKKWRNVASGLKNRKAIGILLIGAFFGPFLGVSFSLISVQYTATGIASTIMSIVPVLIIPPSIILFKEKLKWSEVIGALIAVSGVALFFL